MKKTFVALFALLSVALAAADLSLITPQGPLPIVLPKNTNPQLNTAARELAEHLRKITSRTFPVITENGNPTAGIYLGDSAVARANGIKSAGFAPEEYLIKRNGDKLIITGSEERGTLYGVYHFLEDFMHVHWFTPYFTAITRNSNPTAGDISVRAKPAMPYRDIYLVPGKAGNIFLARNRMNTSNPAFGGRMLFSRKANAHTLYSIFGVDGIRELYRTNPEFFPLINGVRTFDAARANSASQSQLCLTNSNLRKVWVNKMREHIKTDRAYAAAAKIKPPMFYAVDQNDCYDGFCSCPDCDRIVKREKSKSGLMLDFTNHVAAELEKDAPEAIFLMMAIHTTEPPPQLLHARHNVGIRLCDTTSNTLRPWSDPANAKHLNNVKKWAQKSKYITMWDYSITYGSPICVNYPSPTLYTFASDLRQLRANNGYGVFFEHEQVVGGDLRDLKVWLEIKLLENPDLDTDKLIEIFTDGYYGKAAGGKVREYIALLHNAAAQNKANISWFPMLSDYNFIDAALWHQADTLFNQAEKAAAGDRATIRRLEHARLSLDRLYLVRASSFANFLKIKNSHNIVLPDYATVLARYKRVWATENPARDTVGLPEEYEQNVTKFLNMAAARKDLPVPEQFKTIPSGSLHLFSAGMAQTYIGYLKLVKDTQSPAGEALCAKGADIISTPHKDYREDKYAYPFSWTVWPTQKGTVRGKCVVPAKKMPQGYHWYKLGENLQLTQKSNLTLFAGFMLPLDGVVSDNSELGQKYELWARIKITGPDCFVTGKPGKENVFFIDQFAAIRQNSHSAEAKKK